MPKGNHSESNFLNIKALPDEGSDNKPILKSGLSNEVLIEISDGTPIFDVPHLENVDKNALQSIDYRRMKDRLRTTATLKHQQPGEMRIRTVREDGATISVLAFKEAVISANLTEAIRIRAILKDNDYNIPYSDWVNYDFLGKETAQSVNQYRIHGVSQDMIHSQWVYSNVRNKENEEILFKLLHDFLDVTLNVYDDQIDIVTDFMLGDKIVMLIKEHAPEMYNALDLNDELKYRLSEILAMTESYVPNTLEEEMVTHLLETFSLQSETFHEAVSEYFYASIEEFSVLMQSFKFEDHLNFVLADDEKMAQIILKLEDSYEKIVNQSNLEVFLSNDSNSSLFLASCFKLDVKTEKLGHYFNMGFSDAVVSTIQSTVQLLVNLEIPDLVDSVITETYYTDIVTFVSDVLPLYKLLETAEAMVLMQTEDQFKMDIKENPIQYMTFDENGMFSVELAFEVFSFIAEDFLDLIVDVKFLDVFNQVFSEKPLFFIDRLVEEFLIFSTTEEFETLDTTERLDYISEIYQARIISDFNVAMKKIATTPAEEYQIERIEDALIMSSILYYDHYDLDYLGHREANADRYKVGRQIGLIEDTKQMTMGELLEVASKQNKRIQDTKVMGIDEVSSIKPKESQTFEFTKAMAIEELPCINLEQVESIEEEQTIAIKELPNIVLEQVESVEEEQMIAIHELSDITPKHSESIEESNAMTMLEFLVIMSEDESLPQESKHIFMVEFMKHGSVFEYDFIFEEDIRYSKKEYPYRLVSFLIRENMPAVLPEKMLYNYLINLTDHYLIDGSEKIQYGLINKEGDYPIGKFIVGIHPISGEGQLLL